MDFLLKCLVQWRQFQLSRQADTVRRAVMALSNDQRRQAADLTLAEIHKASLLPAPWRHGETAPVMYRPWTDVAGIAAERTRDRSIQLRLRGIAMWLAVVYHETRTATHPGLQAVHREVLGMLRDIKGTRLAPAGNADLSAAA